jgi:hypothetical protein
MPSGRKTKQDFERIVAAFNADPRPSSTIPPGRTLAEVQGLSPTGDRVVSIYVFPVAATEERALEVASLRARGFIGPDGKLRITDPYTGFSGGGVEHVVDLPAGATHVQIAFALERP